MPDKKTLDKAKKAADAPEEGLDAVAEAGDMGEIEGEMDLAEDLGADEMAEADMGMEAEAGGAAGAVQAALDEGVTSAEEMISKLMDAGFEIVPAAGAEMPEPIEPPMGAPATAGDLRERVRGAAARALGGMA
tara:strand:- start:153 stop:551 length:399 start_codon:yes stop_codon:yes gene_type:complete